MRHGLDGAHIRLPIREDWDVVTARQRARELAVREGFTAGRVGAILTALTEIARNIVVHAGEGEVLLGVVEERGRRGLRVVARDEHPGIPDLDRAMRDGWSTGSGLGLGLPSAKRLMDDFAIASAVGAGTTVTMTKWLHDAD